LWIRVLAATNDPNRIVLELILTMASIEPGIVSSSLPRIIIALLH
jgi:hypothetical protein